MQEKSSLFAINFLNRLKSAYKLSTDIELCNLLGIKQNTMPTWKRRNTIDFDLIIAKCDDVSLDWLVSGEGEMFKAQKKYKQADVINYNTVNEEYPPSKPCEYCKEKDERISELKKMINTQSELIDMLKTASPAHSAGQKRKSA